MEAGWPLRPRQKLAVTLFGLFSLSGLWWLAVSGSLPTIALGTEFGTQVQAKYDKDLAASYSITLEKWQRRPLDLRVLQLFARSWEYGPPHDD